MMIATVGVDILSRSFADERTALETEKLRWLGKENGGRRLANSCVLIALRGVIVMVGYLSGIP
jgi:hypothetical protein